MHQKHCCKKNCLAKFSDEDLKDIRDISAEMTEKERSEFLLTCMHATCEDGKFHFKEKGTANFLFFILQ